MFCPNCGAENSKKQNYCRFCGLNLRDTAKSLTSQLVFGEDSGLVKSLSSVRRVMDLALAVTAAAVIVCGVAYFFLGSGFGKEAMRTGMVIFFLFEIALGAVGYYQRKERGKATANKVGREKVEPSGSKEAVMLLEEKPPAAVPSAVEGPTELLPIENRTRKLDRPA